MKEDLWGLREFQAQTAQEGREEIQDRLARPEIPDQEDVQDQEAMQDRRVSRASRVSAAISGQKATLAVKDRKAISVRLVQLALPGQPAQLVLRAISDLRDQEVFQARLVLQARRAQWALRV